MLLQFSEIHVPIWLFTNLLKKIIIGSVSSKLGFNHSCIKGFLICSNQEQECPAERRVTLRNVDLC